MKTLDDIDFENVPLLLPHTGCMVLLDRIIAFSEEGLTAELTVRGDQLFSQEPVVPAWIGIEYMAQSIGAYVGIKSTLAGEPIKLGYLLGTRRYKANIPGFRVGTILSITIKKIMQDEQLGVFECKIYGQDIEIIANLNVYQPPNAIDLTTPC